MPHNATDMIHNARHEFDHLLEDLSRQADQGARAYSVECGLFKQLLALGRTLLGLFFALCAEHSAHEIGRDEAGRPLRLHSHKRRRLVSVFGEIEIERPYFWQAGSRGRHPMDEALSLPEDVYSDLLREPVELFSA